MRRTRSLCGLAIGLALAGGTARAQAPAWPGTTMAPAAPVMQAAYPYPAAMPAYSAAVPGMMPPGPGMMPPAPGTMPPLPPQGAACPLPPGAPPPVPQAEVPPPPVFPTPDCGKEINGFTPGGDNGFSGDIPPDCRPCFAVNVEYLQWFMRSQSVPPLVTTGSAASPIPGALGNGHTRELIGGSLDDGSFAGGRVTFAYWFQNNVNPCTACYHFAEHDYILDVDGSFFGLEQRSHEIGVASNAVGSPVLSRPFFNPNTNREDADPIALPGVVRGSAAVGFTDRMMGAEANLRVSQVGGGTCGSHLNVLAGARWLSLDRDLFIDQAIQELGPPPRDSAFINDQFGTHNRFYGGQVGAEAEYYFWHVVFLKVVGKVAFGESDETASIVGATILHPGAQSFDRGLLAQPTNVGRHNRTTFAYVPELTATVAVQICPGVKLYGGYNFLYWSDVLQPGDQIDRVVSVQPVPARGTASGGPQLGAPRPAFQLNSTDFWVQGAIAGLEISY